MRSINRNTDWGRTARAYGLAAVVLACLWAMLMGSVA